MAVRSVSERLWDVWRKDLAQAAMATADREETLEKLYEDMEQDLKVTSSIRTEHFL